MNMLRPLGGGAAAVAAGCGGCGGDRFVLAPHEPALGSLCDWPNSCRHGYPGLSALPVMVCWPARVRHSVGQAG